ncbi:hypothetical protein PO909_033548, partial [Leuciscus waleckii]
NPIIHICLIFVPTNVFDISSARITAVITSFTCKDNTHSLKPSCNLSRRNLWVTGPTNTFHDSILVIFSSHLVSSAQF